MHIKLDTMALSPIGRKVLLPYGSRREIARRLGVSESYVGQIVNGGRLPQGPMGRKVAVAVARALRMKLHEAFQELSPEHSLHRSFSQQSGSI